MNGDPPNPDKVPTNSQSPSTEPEPERCCQCNAGQRNLVVCIDGTSNKFGKKNTNVIELYNLILKEDIHNQQTLYNSGIGTYATPSRKSLKFYGQVLWHNIDLAIAWDFERTVLAAYRWLSDNYTSGDCIFLFGASDQHMAVASSVDLKGRLGFSRGAYQVRVLSAMIDKVGLIYKGNEKQIPFAYELYVDPESDKPLSSVTQVGLPQTQREISMAERFKCAFSHKDVKVHFVGAWDTVSSIGVARGKNILPRTVDGMKHVCYFRHALALDERRVKFLPEYACGGITIDPTESNNTLTKTIGDNSTGQPPHTLEVWFAGTHSDIGGGNVENVGMDRSRPPLRWMVFEAGALGLRTRLFERDLPPDEQIETSESLTGFWWPLEILPLKRLTYARQDNGKQTTHKPHFGSSRKIQPGQKIHSSLWLSNQLGKTYIPKARPPKDGRSFWDTSTQNLEEEHWLEEDLYNYTQSTVQKFIDEGGSALLENLRRTAVSVDGRQAFYEAVITALKIPGLNPEAKHRLLQSAVDVLGHSDQHLKLRRLFKIRPLVSDLQHSGEQHYEETSKQFLELFTDPSLLFEGHTDWVLSVALSCDGKHISSGSSDQTVRIWDAETEKLIGEPFRGHTKPVFTVAFSPNGERIVSGSEDWTGRIHEVKTGRLVGEPLRGHSGSLRSVAFSPNGDRIVSGSTDHTVRTWDAETGKPIGKPFKGHTGHLTSVAFSPDGKLIVSGSTDRTVRIWNVDTGNPIGKPFQGHMDCVTSVAFSPDGKRVVSGSYDQTVRIWDVETGKPVGAPLEGHKFWVISVAFSTDGRRVISGSRGCTVRIWEVETGDLVGEPFEGHQGSANSIAFSPDRTYTVLGMEDNTVRIWYLETVGTL